MFTGIVTHIGTVAAVDEIAGGRFREDILENHRTIDNGPRVTPATEVERRLLEGVGAEH